jgi:two-component system, cell cycle sensor histidine kinase and response regulator CckA
METITTGRTPERTAWKVAVNVMTQEVSVRILHLEDNSMDAELISETLTRVRPHFQINRVATQPAFEEALKRGDYDLILSDFTMPGFSGAAALNSAKAIRPEAPFIFVSGTIGEEQAVETLQSGATDYVLKGHLDRLPTAIERALREAEQIKERKAAEHALRTSEERFRQLTDNIEQVFFLADIRTGQLVYVSQACEKILGRSCQGFHENPASWTESIAPEDREKVLRARQSAHNTGLFDEEFRIVRPTGELRWIHGRAFPIFNDSGEMYRLAGVGSDITDRKKLEAHILRTQRMESIGTMASGIAHDLNNALAPILMGTEMLRDHLKEDETQAMLELISMSARRGAEMVQHLLTFSRGIDGKHQSLPPARIIREVETILRQTFPKNIRVHTEMPKSLSNVQGDPTQIHQILVNLCVNARDAMPNGGTLNIRAEDFEVDEHFAKMTLDAKPGSYVVLSVRDTGMGMPPEIRERIFEPFFTTKPLEKGTGLGLSTVRGIVKSHGGYISVYSEVGRGSEFRVYLPAGHEQRTPSEDIEKELPLGNGEMILVVDDEEAIRTLSQRALETFNYKVVTASNGAEAIAICARQSPRVDLLLTDIAMPIMDGNALIAAVRSLMPDLKIIAASGLAETFRQTDGGQAGANSFIHKPYTATKLVKTIRDVLDARPSNS